MATESKKKEYDVKAEAVTDVAVIGSGTMGANIAGEFARAGCQVRLLDLDKKRLNAGMAILRSSQATLVEARLLTKQKARAALGRITLTTEMATACDGVQLLIEAVSENMPLKKKMFRQFDKLCPAKAVLASNTSGLSITTIASVTKRPPRVIGMHFWNPPHIIPLVEVTKGRETGKPAAKLLMDICRRIGKRPILVNRDVPGFVGNRLQAAVFREALHLLAAGVASAEDIDTAMTAGPGLRYGFLGPLRTADLGGLDVFHAVSSYLFADLDVAKKPSAHLGELVRKNHLGVKTGEGFYRYDKSARKKTVAQRDRVLLGFLKTLGEEKTRGK
jgi:3-hydroxybutyryl-CoA dehydrogenase